MKDMPGSELILFKEYSSGSLKMKFLKDCKPYKAGDLVIVMPYQVEAAKV